MEFKQILETIWNSHSAQQPCHLVGWWMGILQEVKENIPEDHGPQWHNLLGKLEKLTKIWQKKSKKWEISSFDTLLEKTSKIPGDILATSFSQEESQMLISLWKDCVNMADLDETECLALSTKEITSTSSTIVPIPEDIAGTSSENTWNLMDHLAQLGQKTNQSGNSPPRTGMMSSSISFLENSEMGTTQAKYTLEEKVGKNRVTVSVYYFCQTVTKVIFIYRSTGTMGKKAWNLATDGTTAR